MPLSDDAALLKELLNIQRDTIQQTSANSARLTVVEATLNKLSATVHTGNGQEAVVTQLARGKDRDATATAYNKETRARLMRQEERTEALEKAVSTMATMASVPAKTDDGDTGARALAEANRGFMDILKTIVEKVVVPLLAGLVGALLMKLGAG